MECIEGFDGGLPQKFTIQVDRESGTSSTSSKPSTTVYNQTSKVASFSVGNLEPGTTYDVHIYASNSKGRSETVHFRATTLNLPERRTGEFSIHEFQSNNNEEYRRINEQAHFLSRISSRSEPFGFGNRWHTVTSTVCYAARALHRRAHAIICISSSHSSLLVHPLSHSFFCVTPQPRIHLARCISLSFTSCSQHWSHNTNLIDLLFSQATCTTTTSLRPSRTPRFRDPFTYDPTGKKRANAATHVSISFPWTDFISWFLFESGERSRWERISTVNRRRDFASIRLWIVTCLWN